MEKEFERIHTEISRRLKTDAIDKIVPHIPTDIRFYSPLCKYALSNDIDTSIILFLYVQSNAPFSINKILSMEDIWNLIRKVYFVNSSKMKPYILEIIANLIKEEFDRYTSLDEFRSELNNIVYNKSTLSISENKEETVDVKLENKLCNLHIKDSIDDDTYYRILLHLSNTSRSDILSTIRLEKNDPIYILKLKSKILGKYIHTDVINNLISFLNTKSTLLGFSLSKAIYKIILKSKNQEIIISQLRNMADKIFAKEFLFINLAQIFAYLILRGMHIDVEDMILCMIKYNQYSVYNNEQVRETGLLLLWACIRAEIEFIKLDVLHEIILISLFDCSLNCRRAGSSVLVEYLGRCKIENANELLRLINFDTVKRLATSLANIPEIMNIKPSIKTKVYDLCKQNILTFPVLNERYIFAQILKHFEKCFCQTKLEGRDTQNFRYGLSVYFNASKFCEKCREDSKIQFLHEIDLKRMQSQKIFEPFLEVYMSTMLILLIEFNLYNPTNIIYCLDKNYHPHHISNIVNKIDDKNIKETVYKNFLRRQNDAYILSNSNNSCYYNGIAKIYLRILQGNDSIKKATAIKALEDFLDYKQFEYFEKEEMCKVIKEHARKNLPYTSAIERYDIEHQLLFYMMLGLEDYTVYVKGDAGYFVRHNSIMALVDVDYNISYRYFVRYLVDKSPKLRAGILSSLFSHLRKEAFVIEYDNHSKVLKNENTLSDEHIHFASAFKAYDSLNDDLKEEFVIGILATFRNGDSYTINYIKQYLFGSYEKYMGIVERFLGYKKRYLFLALYFLDTLVIEKPEARSNVLQMLKIVKKDDKSNHLQNIVDNLQAKCLE